MIADVGATPWARDDIDPRILENTIEGRGHILDSQDEVRGYPKLDAFTRLRDPGIRSAFAQRVLEN